MNKKIFGIVLALLLLFIPQTVFAGFATCVMVSDDTDIYIDLTESDILEIKIYNPSGEREYSYALDKEEVDEIMQYLRSNTQEELEYTEDIDIINTFFEQVDDIGYLFLDATGEEVLLYYSYDRMLLSDEELDNGFLTQFIEKKMYEEQYGPIEEPPVIIQDSEDSVQAELDEMSQLFEDTKEFLPEIARTVFSMLASMCIVPLVMFIVFIRILKIAAKRSNGFDTNTRKNNSFDGQRRYTKTDNRKYQNSNRKRDPWSTDNNDDDPFSV